MKMKYNIIKENFYIIKIRVNILEKIILEEEYFIVKITEKMKVLKKINNQ